jgi:hypothetical protein
MRKAQQSATDPRLIPPPIDPATPPLKPPDIVQLEQLPSQGKVDPLEPCSRYTPISRRIATARRGFRNDSRFGPLPLPSGHSPGRRMHRSVTGRTAKVYDLSTFRSSSAVTHS